MIMNETLHRTMYKCNAGLSAKYEGFNCKYKSV